MELLPEILKLFSDAKPGEFAQNLVLFGIAWTMMKRTIKEHFFRIEEKIERMAVSLERAEQTLERVENNHGARITSIEKKIESLSA